MSPAGEACGNSSVFSTLEAAASGGAARQKPFLERLEALYARMDRRYSEIADRCGFHCRGCEDSCCRTTFHHHTLMEYLYLREGVISLEKDKRDEILLLSHTVSANPNAGLICPLNEDGRCLLYAHRPMICRLHGIAHELRRPDGTVQRGPGCAAFAAVSKERVPIALDRTEFYWELSKLEQEARMAMGFFQKVRMTVSQMMETMFLTRAPKESPFHETD